MSDSCRRPSIRFATHDADVRRQRKMHWVDMFAADTFEATPYCGTAPLPTELWSRWNFDPWLIAALVALAAVGLARGQRGHYGRAALSAAVASLIVVFVSPLCALASALFSARVFHHMILIAVIAPLLAVVFPNCANTSRANSSCANSNRANSRGANSSQANTTPLLSLTALALMHAIILWSWHVPGPYAFALSHDAIYWSMQLSLLGSAYLLWRAVLSSMTSVGAAVLALLGTVMQMGLLGALLVFAPRPLFLPHFSTTLPFGLTALQDQQLAGLFMWVPAMLPYLGVALWMSARGLKSVGQPAT